MTHQTCKFDRFVIVAFVILKFKIIDDKYEIILTNDMNLICTNTCIYFVRMIQKSSTVDMPRFPNTYFLAKTREMFVTLFHHLQTVVCLQFNNTLIIVKYSH